MIKNIENYYSNFPSVLESALKNKKISFNSYLEKDSQNDIYDSFETKDVFRKIHRTPPNEDFTINELDFFSQVEKILVKSNINTMKQRIPGSNNDDIFKDIENYSCSFFTSKEALENVLNISGPTNRVIYGHLESRFGIIGYNINNPHIQCWKFKNQDFTKNFFLYENSNG